VLEEAADADVAPASQDVPAVLAPIATEAAAVPVGERPVVADAEMAEASALGASEEGGVETRSVPPSGGLIAVRRSSVGPRIPSLFSTMSERSSPGTSSASVPKQRWGRSGRRWRFFAGTSPKSSR
jgi:hypothetical protein